MKMFKTLGTLLTAALLLAGCGGGASTLSGSGGGTGSTLTAITVTSNPTSVPADGTASAAVSAVALGAGNVAVSGVVITFTVSAGGVLTVTQGTTDGTGTATATVKASTAAAGTNLTVTATSGSVSGTANVAVVALQQTLSISTDSPQINSDGSRAAVITAQLSDSNNNALSGVTVHFTPSSGVLTVTQAVTDASGIAKASLTAGTDPTNRRITVTATAGTATAVTVPVDVTGTTLSLSGPANLVVGGVGSFHVLLTNSAGKGIPNTPVTFSSSNGNTLSSMVVPTDGTGQATVTLTAVNGGNDNVTATALGLSTPPRVVAVSTETFTITAPANGTKISLGALVPVTAQWISGGAPKVGQTVSFASSRGTLSTGTAVTDASGNATVSISSTNAGPGLLSATGTGVAAQSNIDFIATTPTQVIVQASPASVAVQGQSTITATVRDAAGNLVEGQTVTFSLNDVTGGGMSVASAVTDSQGRAQSIYTAGNSTSGANSVTVTAAVPAFGISSTTTITVGGQTVFLTVGTGNTITPSADFTSYSINYAVYATDSQGAAIAGASITMKILPVSYEKGYRKWNGVYWDTIVTTLPGETSCANEDTDYTGNITSKGLQGTPGACNSPPLLTYYSATDDPPKKDYNCNGKLDPGNVASVSPSSGVTGADGKLLVTVSYPEEFAYYVTEQLIASTTVQGTQASTSSTFLLPGATNDFNTQTKAPPGPTSSYGVGTACSNYN